MSVSRPGQNASASARAPRGHVGGQAVERAHVGDQHRGRHLPAAALGVQQRLHGGRGERVGGDAVDGVRGQHDEPPRAATLTASSSAGPQRRRGRSRGRSARSRRSSLSRAAGAAPARDEHPRPAGEVRRRLDVDEAARRAGQPRGAAAPCTSACSITSSPPGTSSRAAARQDRARDVEPVGAAAVEGQVGVVVAHLGVDRLGVRRDVRRVGDEDVDGAVELGSSAGSATSPCSTRTSTPAPRPRCAGPARRPPRTRSTASTRAPGPRWRPPARCRPRRSTGRRRAALAAAGARLLDRDLRDDLGLGARDEDARADGQRQVRGTPARPARCCSGSAGRAGARPGRRTLGEPVRRSAARATSSRRPAEDVRGERGRRRAAGDGTPAVGAAMRARRSPRPARAGRAASLPAPAAASRAASSASIADCTTGASSPSRTASRLYAL